MSRGVLFEDLVDLPGLWTYEEDEVGNDRAEDDAGGSDALDPVDGEGEISRRGHEADDRQQPDLSFGYQDSGGVVHKGADQDPDAHEQEEFLGRDGGTAGPDADDPSAGESKEQGGCEGYAHGEGHGVAEGLADPGQVASREGFAERRPE